ncbi:fucosyltransferase [Klebsormidium nitens]|uniref:Fucosyltransferase n=1 Tax=Klebsormidium nitens TaxID=105231 RepID=A0A1Y1HZH2_KLENI|nr:fucosyltransferase [Klebsormidium nitens]|eukprot:GAQ83583.1 fucosyltransferase [Klebsormidium nitens]
MIPTRGPGGSSSPKLGPWRPSVAWYVMCTLLVLNLLNSEIVTGPLWGGCAKEPANGGVVGVRVTGSQGRSQTLHISPELERAWDEYAARHRASLEAPREHKFFLYKPFHYTGHGNKIPGIVTAFMVALLSNRTLVIDYNDCAGGVNCEISWSRMFDQPLEMDFANLVRDYPAVNETLKGKRFESGDASHINFLVDHRERLSKWDGLQWVWSDGLYDWSAHLWLASPIHGPSLRPLFTPGHIFHALAHFLVHPTLEIQDVVAAARARFRKLTIGVQIRQTKVDHWEPGTYTDRSYFDLARVLQLREGVADNDTAIYLAADSVAVRNAWVKHLENTSIALLMQPEDAVFDSGGKEGLNRDNLPGLKIGVAELFLLSHTHQLIISRGSSFGSTAAALGGLYPWVITQDGYYGSAISDPCCSHTRWLEKVFGADFSPEFFIQTQCHVDPLTKGE